MKRLNFLLATAFLLTILSSCKKDSGTTPAPAVTTTAGSFTWKENGVAFTADSSYYTLCCSPTVTTIFAYKTTAGVRRFFEINITTTANGNFTIPASGFTPCALYYGVGTFGGGQANGGGVIAITNYDNTNNKISGTFSAVQGPHTLSEGMFTGLPKK